MLELLGAQWPELDLLPRRSTKARGPAHLRRPPGVDERSVDVREVGHLAERAREGCLGRVGHVLGGLAGVGGAQIVTERAVDRQVLDAEGVLDPREEVELVQRLLASQRHLASPGAGRRRSGR